MPPPHSSAARVPAGCETPAIRRPAVFVDVAGLRLAARSDEADGDFAGAEHKLRQALAVDPGDGLSLFELTEFLARRGRYGEAEPLYRRMIEAFPDNLALLNSFAVLLSKTGRSGEAIALWQRLAAANPKAAQPLVNIGLALRAGDDAAGAVEYFHKALAVEPELYEAHYNLGFTYYAAGRADAALPHLKTALAIRPDHPRAAVVLAQCCQAVCDWRGLDELMPLLRREVERTAARISSAITPWFSLRLPLARGERKAIAAAKSAEYERNAAPLRQQLAFTFARHPKDVLTVGYISGDFREHPILQLTTGLYKRHDRRRFRIIGYPVKAPDARGAAVLREGCDAVADLSAHSDVEAARRIHADGVDILVDISGFNVFMRPAILALRPAPVQVSYLNFAGTLSGALYDYLIGDPIVTPPEHEADYHEKIVRLPHSYQINNVDQPIGPMPTRAAEGLPEDAFVFACFCVPEKIEPDVFAVWMDVLRAVPGSVLWLFGDSPVVQQNLRIAAAERGIAPGRLVFAMRRPKAEHLGRIALAGLHFDTGTYGAHTTGSDALWAGVPLITRLGDAFPSRVGASLLHAVGLPELIAEDWAAYRRLAVALAHDAARLAALKDKLAAHRLRMPLFDTERTVRALESLYAAMWAESCRP